MVPAGLVLVQIGIFGVGVDRVAVHDVELIGLNGGIDFRSSRKWRVTNNTIEGLNSVEIPALGFIRRAIGIRLLQSSDSLIAFNTITHSSAGLNDAGKIYRGIELIFRISDVIPIENNKFIQNEIAINAPDAREVTDIRLRDRSASASGLVMIFNNKFIQNDANVFVFDPMLLIDHNVVQ